MTNTNNSKKVSLPVLVIILGAVIMLTTLFMPYATAIGENAESLKSAADNVIYEDLNIRAEDMINISMFDYARIYANMGDIIFGSASYGYLYAVFVSLIGLSALFSILFSVLKKPVGVIIFNLFALLVFYAQKWDYTDRRVIPSSSYDWGFAVTVFYIAFAVILIGAVWLVVSKKSEKKQLTE